jgi:uncharacterized membrane protein YvbJ
MNKEIQNELEELDSSLIKIDNSRHFDTHEDYFEKMQQEIFLKIENDSKKRVQVRHIFLWLSGIAASIIIVLGFFYRNSQNQAAVIVHTETFEYLNQNIETLDENTIIEYLDETDIALDQETLPNENEIETYFEENPEHLDDIDIEKLF